MNDDQERPTQPTTGAAPRPREWRRFIPRLSVRETMILVLAVGGLVGWYLRSVRIQRDAVEALRRAGASVHYDWIWVDHDPFGFDLVEPSWWSETVDDLKPILEFPGPDYFKRVVAVYSGSEYTLSNSKADDAFMSKVARLKGLRRLAIKRGVAITDAGLAELEGLTNMRWLELERMGPSVTDAGIARLKGMVDLKSLTLQFPGLTGAGLDALRGMNRLESLDLDGSGVDDLATIRRLPVLRTLELRSTPIDDEGLAPVADLNGLIYLGLSGTKVTDAGLAHMRGLTKLIRLNLDGTRVADAGLANLGGLSTLKSLSLNRTDVGDEGVRRLAGLGSLELLEAAQTRVTDAGMNALWGPRMQRQYRLKAPDVPDTSFLEYHRLTTK